jgi:hypothetical protein
VRKITVGSSRVGGPRLRAIDPWLPDTISPSTRRQLLSDDERARLATIATIVRFKKGEQVYSDGGPAKAIFNVISGLIKSTGQGPMAVSMSPHSSTRRTFSGCRRRGATQTAQRPSRQLLSIRYHWMLYGADCPRTPNWSSMLSRSFVTSSVRHNVMLFCLHKDTPYPNWRCFCNCKNMFSRPTSSPRRYTCRWTVWTSQTMSECPLRQLPGDSVPS